MKKNIFSIIILFTLVFSKTFSQEVNKIGVHLELEYSTEITKKGDNVGGFSFFVTPSYKIGENATVGIGTGAKLFKSFELINDVGSIEYRDKKLVSIPLYVNTMYKFKVNKTTRFVLWTKRRNLLYNYQMQLYQVNRFDSREIELTVRYNFNTVKSKYKGVNASDDEIKRF